jgi:hypothetical protein
MSRLGTHREVHCFLREEALQSYDGIAAQQAGGRWRRLRLFVVISTYAAAKLSGEAHRRWRSHSPCGTLWSFGAVDNSHCIKFV